MGYLVDPSRNIYVLAELMRPLVRNQLRKEMFLKNFIIAPNQKTDKWRIEMLRKRIFLTTFLIFVLAFTGCFGGTALKEITISAESDTVEQGKSITLEAKGIDKKKNEVVLPNPQWKVSDQSKGKIEGNGSKITFKANNDALGKVTVEVTSGKVSGAIELEIVTPGSAESESIYLLSTGQLLFRETFNNVPNGTNIRNDQSKLDNPQSFSRSNMSGTITAQGGAIEMGTQRFAISIPGLANAQDPILRIRIKNDNGSGKPVSDLKLAVGNRYTTSGAVGEDGYRAHGEYKITNSSYQYIEIPLNKKYTNTGLINFRGIVGTKGTAGLFIDQIEVWDGGGSGGSDPGEPDPDPDPGSGGSTGDAYFDLVGWAAMNGGTTGGAGGEVIYVSNGRELYDALYANERRHKGDKKYGDPVPLTIYVNGRITKSNTGQEKIDIKDQADVSIIGVGNKGELDGIGIKITRSNNIIIRNLTIHHVRAPEDGIEITDNSKNIWIDRNTFYNELLDDKDYYDGLLDIKTGSEYITISWNKFYNNSKGLLVGHSDSANNPTRITYHHNHFYNLNSRVPLIRSAEVHMFNNYFQNIVSSAINSRMGAKVRVENNYFEKVGSGKKDSHAGQIEGPIGWWYGSSQTGYWQVIGNKFVNCPVSSYSSTTTVNIPYDYSKALNSADRAKELVLQYAGAGSPSL